MIDILLSTYNGENFLREQIESLLWQTNNNFQIIARDDCSTDNTLEILNEYKKNYPNIFRIIDNEGKNLGSTESFFNLLSYSTSDMIMFCDQDDVWDRDKLELMQKFYNENVKEKNKPALIHTYVDVVDEKLLTMQEETELFNKRKCGMENNFTWQIFQNDVTGCTVMINSSMRESIIKSRIKIKNIIQHDWFLAQVAWLFGNKYCLPSKTIKYRQHSNNLLGAKKISFIKKIRIKYTKGISYPYYMQINELLNLNNLDISSKLKELLTTFSRLNNRTKIYRIYWHLKNHWLRDGGITYKLYQLLIC